MYLTREFKRYAPTVEGVHRLVVVNTYTSEDKEEIDDFETKLHNGIGYQMVEIKDLRKGETV